MKMTATLKMAFAALPLLGASTATLHAAEQATGSLQTTAAVIQRVIAIDNVCAWPNLTTLRDGTIIATIFNQPTHGGWEGDVECWASRDGRLWEKRGTPAPHEPGSNRMNVAAGLARDGSLMVLASGWSNRPQPGKFRSPHEGEILPVWICRSSDGGRIWTHGDAPVPPPAGRPARLVPFGDIVPLADGALGVCIYNAPPKAKDDHTHFYASRDDGRTWSERGMIRATNLNETTLVVLPGGRLLAAGRTLGDQHLDLFTSDDHGAAWKCTGPVTKGAQHPADLTMLADGRVLLTYGNRIAARFGVEARISADQGATWGDPISVVSDLSSGDCGYPASVQLPSGEILTAYYAHGVASHQRYHMGAVVWKRPGATTAQPAQKAGALDIGSRRELFVDHFLIDKLNGAQLHLHTPRDEGVALPFSQPWEGLFSGYVTIVRDGQRLLAYYRGKPAADRDGSSNEITCCAESSDGVRWTRPDLGLFEVQGTKKNNVILANASPTTHNFCPFRDERPGVPADERFKALGGTMESGGLVAWKSADGLRWQRMGAQAVITKAMVPYKYMFDSQNVSFWSAAERKYLCYYRVFEKDIRRIVRSESDDFLHWSPPVLMEYRHPLGPSPVEHLYTNQTHPYFRAPHLYVAIAARFMPGRRVLTDEQAKAIKVNPGYFKDTSDAIFMTTRPCEGAGQVAVYDRTFLEGFIRGGIGPQNWVSRTGYPALNVVQTGPAEMSVYVNQDYAQPTAHLRRYSLRLDGFASLRAGYRGGEMVSKPLVFTGRKLSLNFATSAAGSVRVEVQDASGQPLPGFSLAECQEQIGNELDRVVNWKNGGDVSALAGKPVRLRFVLKDADVYAFQFTR